MGPVGRFEGVYGALYDRAIAFPLTPRVAPLVCGPVTGLLDLDRLAARVASALPAGATLLDVPGGGAPLLGPLARAGFTGTVVAADLAEAMLARARERARRTPAIAVRALRADALALPLDDAAVDGAVSLNGIHCLDDAPAFLRELARVVRPGGPVVVVTLVARGAWQTELTIAAGRLTGIIPRRPPARDELVGDLRAAGFTAIEDLGGAGLVGLAARRA